MGERRVKGFSRVWLVIVFCLSFSGNVWVNASSLEGQIPPTKEKVDFSRLTYVPFASNDSPQPPDSPETIFGLEMRHIDGSNGLLQVTEANASFIRLNGIRWGDIEPEEGQRKWEAVADREKQLRTAAENNLHVILVVRLTPGWAQKIPGVSCGPVRQDKLEAFGDFMYDLVARYHKAPYFVKYWEIWNEPDVDPDLAFRFSATTPFGCWGDPADELYGGGYYAEMLKAIYPRIKAADPEAQVLVGGLLMSCNPASGGCSNSRDVQASKFFEGILANQGGASFDGVAFHNYDTFHIDSLGRYSSSKWGSAWNTTGPALIAKANFLDSLLAEYQVEGKYLMNTETALLCGGNSEPPGSPGCEAESDSLYERSKAYYVAQAYAAAAAVGLRANVWYSLNGWRNSGLVYSDYAPRPALTAFQFSRSRLEGFSSAAALTSADVGGVTEILGYKFTHPDGRLTWVIWSKNGRPQTVPLSTPPSGVWDSLGEAQPMADPLALSVTLNPLYVEWIP
jgi:hypothetical protein